VSIKVSLVALRRVVIATEGARSSVAATVGCYAFPVSESPLTASLLVAMPQLQDPNFLRSVMMIVQHDIEGTFGLVLNRPVDMSASELCEGLDMEWGGNPETSLHWGGPVQPHTGWMLFAHDDVETAHVYDQVHEPALESEEMTSLVDGVCFAGSLNVLRTIVEAPPGDVRLFLGYAGWGPGQLEMEMAEGVWLNAPATREVIFDVDADDMWDTVVRSLGIDPATLILTPGVH
jgi:putative transcriptional regulator